LEAVRKPREMLRHPERLAGVHRHHFVDAVAVDEGAVEHGDLRVAERQEFPVQVNHSVGVDHDFPWWLVNQSRTVSTARPKRLASGTCSSATSGNSATALPSSATLTVPTGWPLSTGAMSGSFDSSVSASWSALPLGRERSRSARHLAGTTHVAHCVTRR